ncbi:proteasome assembly chaperone 4 isoform X1 [Struthio camelus]|uniref:proteasome assembly chaperone 4 isoform X1 n=1 Tax=Struthio camelus TaxID=8801 RepID=UPI003604211E
MEPADGGGQAAAAGIALHDFSGQLGEQLVHFHAMRLRDSLFLWVGAAPALASLAVAMCNPRDSVPVSASLLGDPSDPAAASLARRLACRGPSEWQHNLLMYNLLVFTGSNLSNTQSQLKPGRPKNRYLSATTFKTQTAVSAYS